MLSLSLSQMYEWNQKFNCILERTLISILRKVSLQVARIKCLYLQCLSIFPSASSSTDKLMLRIKFHLKSQEFINFHLTLDPLAHSCQWHFMWLIRVISTLTHKLLLRFLSKCSSLKWTFESLSPPKRWPNSDYWSWKLLLIVDQIIFKDSRWRNIPSGITNEPHVLQNTCKYFSKVRKASVEHSTYQSHERQNS